MMENFPKNNEEEIDERRRSILKGALAAGALAAVGIPAEKAEAGSVDIERGREVMSSVYGLISEALTHADEKWMEEVDEVYDKVLERPENAWHAARFLRAVERRISFMEGGIEIATPENPELLSQLKAQIEVARGVYNVENE